MQRAMDDGEPVVPGVPMLKENELKDVGFVVTRYFGGTKTWCWRTRSCVFWGCKRRVESHRIAECRLENQLA